MIKIGIRKPFLYLIIVVLLALPPLLMAAGNLRGNHVPSGDEIILENDTYTIIVPKKLDGEKNKIEIRKKGENLVIRHIIPELTVFFSATDPGYKRGRIREGSTPVASWGEDNIEIWDVVKPVLAKSDKAELKGKTILFSFQNQGEFDTEMALTLPDGNADPNISWSISPLAEGWFSVGFTGIQEIDQNELDFLYQPLVWSWKRFPSRAVLTPEAYATTASTFTNRDGVTEGLAVPSHEIPYRFADFANSRFGLMLRTAGNMAKPMAFAPVFGGEGSFMKPGQRHTFSLQYYVEEGDWLKGTDYLYSNVLQYRIERQNAMVSLNQTLQNIIDFAMDDYYSGWIEEYKGYDYKFDVPNTVKNVSALHPLSVALTTGNKEIYDRRGLPMMEYLMSREKFLYAINAEPKNQSQNPSHYLKGPAMEIWEIASMHTMLGKNNMAFTSEIERLFGQSRQLNLETEVEGASWKDYLARYQITDNPSFLDSAVRLADEYMDLVFYNYPKDFSTNAGLKDAQATFVNDYSSNWQELLELYETTNETKYLDAAYEGAKQLVLWTRSNPFAPDSLITANKGSLVKGVFPGKRFKSDSYEWQEYDTSTEIQEQIIPAWHTSLVGLLPEQPGTYVYGPIMLFHQAGDLLRLAYLKKDVPLKNIAYNAIIGRYNNFPGYYFTSLETNVYQQTDYVLRPYMDVKYNALFYNHIWPHISFLQDFLVSDAYFRSKGNIDFPSLFSPGYAFLTNKVYGHQPGKIYDNENVFLWLPKNPFTAIDKSLNYLLGRDENNTYLVVMNTAREMLGTDLLLDPSVVKWDHGMDYECHIYSKDGKMGKGTLSDGKIPIHIPGEDILTIKIIGLKNEITFQTQHVLADTLGEQNQQGFFRKEYNQPFLGTVSGMVFKLNDKFKDLYIYSSATEEEVKEVELQYRIDEEEWQSVSDKKYPFEFSIRTENPNSAVQLKWSATARDGAIHETEIINLK